MKQKLAKIYHDLSEGKLTKEQALEQIRAVKLLEQNITDRLILANPVWEPGIASVETSETPAYTQHHILVCDMNDIDVAEIERNIFRSNCVMLTASQNKNIAERYIEISILCYEQIKSILKSKPQGKVLVQIVISNTQDKRHYVGISGLLRSAALENPQFIGQLILSEPESAIEELRVQLLNGKINPQDNVLKYEQGVRHALRLKEAHELQNTRSNVFKDKGVYLITGGLGGLGIKFAEEIVEQTTSADIILAGRAELTPDKKALLQKLSSNGNHVAYHQIDISDFGQLQCLIDTIIEKYTALNGIIHCAGVISDNFIIKKTSKEFRKVLVPKVLGAFNLDQASRSLDLDFMVLFSSTASWFGNIGQSDYAAANGFLDQFAAYRNQLVNDKKRLGRTVSINWPYWEEGGMSISEEGQEMLRQNLGMESMDTAVGTRAFYRSLELNHNQVLVMNGDAKKIKEVLFADESVLKSKPIDESNPEQTGQSVVSSIDSKKLLEKTQEFLKKQLSTVLNLPANKIDVHAPLERYGIDSIMAMNLTNQLEKTFGSLSKTLFFEYQALDELSEYFINNYTTKLAALFPVSQTNTSPLRSKGTDATIELDASIRKVRASVLTPQSHFAQDGQANATSMTEVDLIAIVGLSGRYPEAPSLQEYWRNLSEGKDCITEVPKSRWDWREYYSEDRTKAGRHYSKWGGFISGVDEFDPRFFNISPREAETIDPQERLFLVHSWMAIEDAGYNRAGLQIAREGDLPGQVGVYAGVMYGEYNLSGSLASIANRVSYVLNLHGPSLTVDTMCSSSLSAIHLACQDLNCGRINLAIAGGVNVSISPNKYSVLSEGQFISSEGHCQSFGEGGDGYIPGEGVGVVVLKKLSEAKRDKNHIYGIIRGTALNHGGKTNGYSVPNPQAQASVISRALTESKIHPRYISYIEAHGTGTKLGDPIEIFALSKAFQQHTKDIGFCLIGSAKSNIGHCESAAGMAGLTKVLLQMKYQQIVPSLHSERLNPNINFEKNPFVVNQKLRAWEQPIINGMTIPRIAGVSSFGAGGSNAHVIVEEYLSDREKNNSDKYCSQDTNVIVVLSARTEDQLKQKARDLYEFIGTSENEEKLLNGKALDLFAIAYTLQVGREALEERVGFLVNSIQQLEEKLRAWISGQQGIEDCFQGQVKPNRDNVSLFSSDHDLNETLNKWIDQKSLSKLLDWWVKGLQFNWDKLYGNEKPARISLPTYPFAKERYWLDAAARGQKTIAGKTPSVLHPLLHLNTSDLRQQSFSSIFTGEEFFIKDYRANEYGSIGPKVLPIVATLEMVRAAIQKALPVTEKTNCLKLYNISLCQPILIEEDKQINIALFENDEGIEYEIYSQEKEGEVIYCQGLAIRGKSHLGIKHDLEQLKAQMWRGKLESASLYNTELAGMGQWYGSAYHGITELYKGDRQLLAEICIPGILENSTEDYILHPTIMEGAMQASLSLIVDSTKHSNTIIQPYAIESINILSPCSKKMFAWVHGSQASPTDNTIHKCDIDLCDQNGNLLIEILGITYHFDIANATGHQPEEMGLQRTPLTPKQISFTTGTLEGNRIIDSQIQDFVKGELTKPSISLDASDTNLSVKFEYQSLRKSLVTLSDAPLQNSPQVVSSGESTAVSLYDNGSGVFEIRISDGGMNTLTEGLIFQLTGAIEKVRHDVSTKVLIISGTERYFLYGNGKYHHEVAMVRGLYRTIASFPYPVIACMQGDAAGAGFLVGALCDFMVCNLERHYSYTNPAEDLFPTEGEEALFAERFGEIQAVDFLYQALTFSKGHTGEHLKGKGWTCPILPSEQVKSHAHDLALNLCKKNQESLRLLKQHLARRINRFVNGLEVIEAARFSQPDKAKQSKKAITSTSGLQVECHGESILLLQLHKVDERSGIKSLICELSSILGQVSDIPKYRVAVLTSEYPDFLPESSSPEDVMALGSLILDCTIPVIAVMGPKAQGKGWFFGHHCDAMVYQAEGCYSAADILQSSELAGKAAIIFTHRLGNSLGEEILLTGKVYTGADLQGRIGSLMVGTQDLALKLAASWGTLPEEVLTAWKRRCSSRIHSKMENLLPGKQVEQITTPALRDVPVQVPLASKAIIATAHPEGILEVRMEDRTAKNMFSIDLMNGINEIFAHVAGCSMYKVVVLAGYDNYFASGGTKESLLAIHEGKVKFTDNKIYQLAMECNIPVIAAMQGHGVGAGWSMGMFADIVLFSRESKYMSPYMNYGFTPGAGATMIFPRTIGYDLARETMLTGQEYSGSKLKSRGLQHQVLPRGQVFGAAMSIARDVAKYPINSLMYLKRQLTQHLAGEVEEAYSLELAMHGKTFVGNADTLNQIERNFAPENNHTRSGTRPVEVQAGKFASNYSSDGDLLALVNTTIKKILAQELHIHENEIDGDAQFVDLGLDSITGVTWIRKINEKYRTSIEATKVYSYTTLNQMSRYVREEAEKAGSLVEKEALVISHNTGSTKNIEVSQVSIHIKGLLAIELHMQEHEIDEDAQFVDLGLDSITGVTWIRKINEKYKTSIEATKIYSYSTLKQMCSYVEEEARKQGTSKEKSDLKEAGVNATVSAGSSESRRVQLPLKKFVSIRNRALSRTKQKASSSYQSQPIAVIGMGGQFPQANNIEEFWKNIANGKNCISEIPKERWNINAFYQDGRPVAGKTNCKFQGSIEGYDLFDPLFFTISPLEAESMDPQQRLFLQTCWHSIENAGYNPKDLSGSKCGVFVGCGTNDYQLLSRELQISAQGFTGVSPSILAARISYFLNLQGPCLSIETACSSSLVAIANACDSLVAGSSDMALAGGVYVMAGPELHVKTAQSGMLSQDGKCYTFDQRANGFVPGEAVGVVMLKRLADAERDQDNIYGVIQGWGVNQDGKTNGITAPNSESQTRLEQEVYDKFGIDPNQIQLVEAHGTGTKLGDPIEVDALKQSFKKYTDKKEYCALGSVKSNIGHCLTAAGIAGFIKVIMSLEHKKLPPTINYENLNEHINLKDSPFYVNTQLKDWDTSHGQKRQAAISAFGFSGTNAHVVVSEYLKSSHRIEPLELTSQPGKAIIPLSARSIEQLKQKALDLLRYIQRVGQSVNLMDVAYTLQIGREAMEVRLGLNVHSTQDLEEKLQNFIEGKQRDGIFVGEVKRNNETLAIFTNDDDLQNAVEAWISRGKFDKFLELWVKGLPFNWQNIYKGKKLQRLRLPVYPFAKEHYWVSVKDPGQPLSVPGARAILHPLLHTNTSDLSCQKYSSTFSGEEFFFKDHQVNGKRILPGVGYLEMARVAIRLSSPDQASSILEMFNTTWFRPFEIGKQKQVSIALVEGDNDRIDYEIYSVDKDVADAPREILYCQGQAEFRPKVTLAKLNVGDLERQMRRGRLDASDAYAILSNMGFNYGPAHQGVRSILLGEGQVLAHLCLPPVIVSGADDYFLHPSVMDSALQATVGLITDMDHHVPGKPSVPFLLETLRILSPCTKEMFAWVRHSKNKTEGQTIKVDIDVCDKEGNICVQMEGFTSRVMGREISSPDDEVLNNSGEDNNDFKENNPSFDEAGYKKILAHFLNKEVSIDEALDLV